MLKNILTLILITSHSRTLMNPIMIMTKLTVTEIIISQLTNRSDFIGSDCEKTFQDLLNDGSNDVDSSSDNSAPEEIMSMSIRDQLKNWSLEYNVNLNSLSAILKILKMHKCYKDLPSDARAIMGTPKIVHSIIIQPGKYVHFGFMKGITKILEEFKYNGDEINLDVNIDGLPLSNSGRSQAWPIQARVCEVSESLPFFVGIWQGQGKPKCFNNFLSLFVQDAKELILHGISFKEKVIATKIRAFICDAPARAEISYTKG
ncbi:unnamed protein product, partial [Allacma fusca]